MGVYMCGAGSVGIGLRWDVDGWDGSLESKSDDKCGADHLCFDDIPSFKTGFSSQIFLTVTMKPEILDENSQPIPAILKVNPSNGIELRCGVSSTTIIGNNCCLFLQRKFI